MDPNAFFQIVAVPDTGTHEHTVLLAARASVLAWHTTSTDIGWAPWWAGPFTKSVRRYERSDIAKLEAIAARKAPGCPIPAVKLTDDHQLTGYGFAPARFDDLPKPMRRLRVSGLDRPRTGWDPTNTAGPHIAINPHVEMTTGKTAAQTAHALMLHYQRLHTPEREAWMHAGMPVTVTEPDDYAALPATIEIRDAGFTEIAPGTSTVKVLNGRH